MSIELMKRALEFITGVYFGEHEGSRADREKLEADLTTAIQQAEAQQPATGEPVLVQHRKPFIGWKGETLGYTGWMEGKGLDGWPHRELYDHPAPSVRDAERYRWLRDPKNHAQIGVGQWTDDGFGWRYSDEADAAIDAAMLAAKEK